MCEHEINCCLTVISAFDNTELIYHFSVISELIKSLTKFYFVKMTEGLQKRFQTEVEKFRELQKGT